MKIEIIAVGQVKEKYIKAGLAEYMKRLQPYGKVKIIEVADEPAPENLSDHEKALILDKEAEKISRHLSANQQVITLAIEGDLISSEDLAQHIEEAQTYGTSKLSFIIGGSLGLAESLKSRADASISFGRITLPHQLMRLVLVEQIYRAYRIIHGHAYHK